MTLSDELPVLLSNSHLSPWNSLSLEVSNHNVLCASHLCYACYMYLSARRNYEVPHFPMFYILFSPSLTKDYWSVQISGDQFYWFNCIKYLNTVWNGNLAYVNHVELYFVVCSFVFSKVKKKRTFRSECTLCVVRNLACWHARTFCWSPCLWRGWSEEWGWFAFNVHTRKHNPHCLVPRTFFL
jgi:hypothetical protein